MSSPAIPPLFFLDKAIRFPYKKHPIKIQAIGKTRPLPGGEANPEGYETRTLNRIAFVFGSIARQEVKAASDEDLMVIGSIGLKRTCNNTAPFKPYL